MATVSSAAPEQTGVADPSKSATASGTASGAAPAVTAQAKYAKEINSYVSEYIRFADLKAGATLTLTIAMSGALGSAIPKIVGAANTSSATKTVFVVLFVLAAIAAVLTILYSAFVLIPRVPPTPTRSLNSFPDIAQLKPEDYAAQIAALTESDIAKNLSVHNVTLALVAKKKFNAITTAIWSLVSLLFVGFVIIVFYVCANV